MKPVISIGNQDFSSIRENNSFYIDKTSFIKDLTYVTGVSSLSISIFLFPLLLT